MLRKMCTMIPTLRFSGFPAGFPRKQNKEHSLNVHTYNLKSSNIVTALSRSQHKQNERLEVGPFFINYVKVGKGPHVVFCFPGILGRYIK